MNKSKVSSGFARATLRPLIRFCIKHSIKLQEFTELAKELFVDIAEEQLAKANSDASNSRISMMTGVHRRDVTRLRDSTPKLDDSRDLPARILGQWQSHPDFVTKSGSPRVLTCETNESEFSQLVRSISSDVSPYSVLFELQRVGAVVRGNRGLKLVKQNFIPRGDIDLGLHYLETDTHDLLSAISENLLEPERPENLHLKTEYTRIDGKAVNSIREWLLKEGSAFHRRVRSHLAKYDLDVNPTDNVEKIARIAVATFSFTEEKE
jgi:hypothetical protein